MTGEVRLVAQGALPQAKRQRTVRQERLAASVNRITYLFPDVDGDGDLPGQGILIRRILPPWHSPTTPRSLR